MLTIYCVNAIIVQHRKHEVGTLIVDIIGRLLHLVQRGGALRPATPSSPLIAVPNVTAHPSVTSVLITDILLHGYRPTHGQRSRGRRIMCPCHIKASEHY